MNVLRTLTPGTFRGSGDVARALLALGWTVADGDADLVVGLEGSAPLVVVVGAAERPVVEGYQHVLWDGELDLLVRDGEPVPDLFAALEDEVALWRSRALDGWQDVVTAGPVGGGLPELLQLRQSISWRVTRPLRTVRSRLPGA